MILEIAASFVVAAAMLILLEDPWKDFRKGEISFFELFFVTMLFLPFAIITLMLIWN